MTLLILLFIVGILLILAEVILPGGIIGTLGGLMIFASCVLAFIDFGPTGGLIAVLLGLILGGAALVFEFRYLPKTQFGRRAFLNREITAVSTAVASEAAGYIGRTAEAVTMLSPSGYIVIDGQRFEAFCQNGQAPVGSTLEIVGADNFRLIVNRPTPTPSTTTP